MLISKEYSVPLNDQVSIYNMKKQGNFNEQSIGPVTDLKWTAPEINILDLENTELGADGMDDGTAPSGVS